MIDEVDEIVDAGAIRLSNEQKTELLAALAPMKVSVLSCTYFPESCLKHCNFILLDIRKIVKIAKNKIPFSYG